VSAARDVTAVVLTIGEPTTARAVASVERQTLPVRTTTVVSGVTPFHRALNVGAARTSTPFFVQVDADMVLDPDCVERLAACVPDNVGLVVGQLRDPLYGRVTGIKLFRTECARRHPFADSISPDTDFTAEIGRAGWATIYALRHGPAPEHWHTFGEHDPSYGPLYTYAKHTLEGRRLRYRGAARAVEYQLGRLRASAHPQALTAQIALAHGLCLDGDADLLSPYAEDRDFLRLMDFLSGRGNGGSDGGAVALRAALFPRAAFRRAYKLGIALAADRRADRLERALATVYESRAPWSWLMAVGLCHGIFVERYEIGAFEADWMKLRALCRNFESGGRARRLAALIRRMVGTT
jgi:hypothetical protein